ncbi:MAG: phage portal protein [Pseudomonadota bacterium]
MNLFGLFKRARAVASPPRAMTGLEYTGLDDPRFLEMIRNGGASTVTVKTALKNSAVSRSVELLSSATGMLPLLARRKSENGKVVDATDHPMYGVLKYKPNTWQNAFQFKQQMQFWALLYGNSYAVIVRSRGRVIGLNPIHPDRVRVKQESDFSLRYEVSRQDASYTVFPASNILHIRGQSEDGVTGLSKVQQAGDIIGITLASQAAADRMYQKGMHLGGHLKHPSTLGKEAMETLRASLEAYYSGPENAGKWLVTEENMEATPFENNAVDGQLVEMRAALVEEIGRLFGVPRPLLGVDDTSWGTGVEQLGILFVRYGLAPWFKVWEDEISIKCFAPSEWGTVYPDFDERELLRGTIKEQFEAFAKASGAGGHKPWLEANEIRELTGLGVHEDGYGLTPAGKDDNEQNNAVQTASA